MEVFHGLTEEFHRLPSEKVWVISSTLCVMLYVMYRRLGGQLLFQSFAFGIHISTLYHLRLWQWHL